MAAPAFTFLEKKWAGGWSSNTLYPTATQNNDRQTVPSQSKDVHQLITPTGRKTLSDLGRRLSTSSLVAGAIDEIATWAALTFIPKFWGDDEVWGEETEQYLYDTESSCIISGESLAIYRRLLVFALFIDGEMGRLKTKSATGMPMIQIIPSHRIRCIGSETTVESGPYKGLRIVDGVIVNSYARPVAYRVAGENPNDPAGYRDISARDLRLNFLPKFAGQLRGFSELGASAWDLQDVRETRDLEKIVQKLGATFSFEVHNETGEPDKAKQIIQAGTKNADGSKLTHDIETRNGVTMNYFKAGTNQKISAVKTDRPTMNQQAYEDRILRGAYAGMCMSVDANFDPTKLNGGALRFIIDKMNRQVEKLQTLVIEPDVLDIDRYRVACVMDNPERTDKEVVLIPFNEQWHRWGYQPGARLTGDAKYDSELDLQESARGVTTDAKVCAKRGQDRDDVYKTKQKENAKKWKAAQENAAEFGIPIEVAYNSMWSDNPNGIQAAKESTPDRLKREDQEFKDAQ